MSEVEWWRLLYLIPMSMSIWLIITIIRDRKRWKKEDEEWKARNTKTN